MNSLELVRKLYEGETDLQALEKELDEGAREELQQLVEAKRSLEALPRSRPSRAVIDSIIAKAAHKEAKRSPLALVLTNRALQRMAAAAIVVVAVGIGYLTLRTDSIIPIDSATEMARSNESPALGDEVQTLGKEEQEDLAAAPSETGGGRMYSPEAKAATPPAAQKSPEAEGRFRSRDFDQVGAMAEAEPPSEEAADDNFALLDRDAAFADTSFEREGDESPELLSWDQEEEALRTFFWQVRALDGRSPGDDWEEAVPLEGSFEMLEKQQPGTNRWLQTGGQR